MRVLKNIYLASLVLGLTSYVLIGCDTSTQSASEPFTTATEWTYSNTDFDAGGNLNAGTNDTVTIISSTIQNSKKNITFSDNCSGTLIPNGSSWVLSTFNPTDGLCSSAVIPAHKGDTVLTSQSIPTKIEGVVTNAIVSAFIKDVNQSITVPAGSFDCFIVEMDFEGQNNSMKAKSLYYVSPIAGLVQREYYVTDPKTGTVYLKSRSQLLSLK